MRLTQRQARPGNEQRILGSRPDHDTAVARCVQCWRNLSSERSLGFAGAGPIPWTAIVDWASYQRLDRVFTDVLIDVIGQLDADRARSEASRAAFVRKGKP